MSGFALWLVGAAVLSFVGGAIIAKLVSMQPLKIDLPGSHRAGDSKAALNQH